PKERGRLRRIEAFTRQQITQSSLPTVEDIQKQREAELVEQMMVWLRRGRCRRERELVAELVESGHDPAEVAAAALKLARAEEKQRPIAPVSEVQAWRPQNTRRSGKRDDRRNGQQRNGRGRNGHNRATDSYEEGMVRLSLNTGKANGIRVNHVVSALAHYADIPGHSFGKIRIQEQH
ncbi:MAG: RNA helicase, partial [Chloroflexi bacterium]|nr:RNA helicase [Chloroflexota bacterium]